MAAYKVSIPRRSVSVVLAATMASSMVPAIALASNDTASLQPAAVATSTEALDPANLPDGEYTVSVRLLNAGNPGQDSMANSAVSDTYDEGSHIVKLEVVDGEYWVTLNFHPLTLAAFPGFTGYLAQLGYYDNGTRTGNLCAAEIVSEWLNDDGTYVVDMYNAPDSSNKAWDGAYPKQLRVRVSKNIVEQNAETSDQLLHVFVPVMDAIQKGSGNQDCLMRVNWAKLEVVAPVVDKTALESAISTAQGIAQGAKTDDAYRALQSAIAAAAAVRDNASATADDVASAAAALNDAVEAFNNAADQVTGENPYNLTVGTYYSPTTTAADTSGATLANGVPFTYGISRTSWASVKYNADGTYLVTLVAPSDVTITSLTAAPAGQTAASAGYQSGVDTMFGKAVTYWSFAVDSIENGVDIWVSYDKQPSVGSAYSRENEKQTLSFAVADGTLPVSKLVWASELWPALQEAKALEQGNKSDEAWESLQEAIAVADNVCGKVSPMNGSSVTQSEVNAAATALVRATEAFKASPDYIVGEFGLELGVLYDTTITIKDGRVNSVGAPFFGSWGCSAKLLDSGLYRVSLYTSATATINSLQVVSDDGTVLSDGYQSDTYDWSIDVSTLMEPVKVKVSYTDNKGNAYDKTLSLTFASKASGYTANAKPDRSDLWMAVNVANQMSVGAKSDQAWADFADARAAAANILRHYDEYAQEDLDAAKRTLDDAVATLQAAEDQQGSRTYLLEPGAWYQRVEYGFYAEDGTKLLGADNPLMAVPLYRLNADGTFDLEVAGSEKLGTLLVPTAVSYSATGDTADMQPAVKSGEGGGYAHWRLSLDNLEQDIPLLVTYVDLDGSTHENVPVTLRVEGLFSEQDFGFIASSATYSGDLYIALQEAKALQADESFDKTSHAEGELGVRIATADLFYVLNGTAETQTQEDIDAQTAALKTAMEAFKAAPDVADAQALAAKIDEACALGQGNKTDEVFAALQTAIEAAKAVRDDAWATQVEVRNATGVLSQAITDFENGAVVVDRSALSQAIADAEATEQGAKTDEAFAALQEAIGNAKAVLGNAKATQDQVDLAVTVLENACSEFAASPDKPADTLDFSNLADGIYSLNVEMFKTDRTSKSMSDAAVGDKVMLEVKNGEYYLTFDFNGLAYAGQQGYLGKLWYFDDGYTYNAYGVPVGNVVEGTVVDYQVNDDGSYVTDAYSGVYGYDKYPNKVTVKYVKQARDAGDGWVPLQVFVPVMEAIGGDSGTGTQPVMAKLDLSSLEKANVDDFTGGDDGPVVLPGESLGSQLGNGTGTGASAAGTGVSKSTLSGAGSSALAGKSGLSQTGDDNAVAVATAGVAAVAAAAAAAFAATRRRFKFSKGE